jgi:hypothetical protein
MSLDSMRGTICGRALTAAPSSVDVKRPEAHRSCADLRYSFYGIMVVITDTDPLVQLDGSYAMPNDRPAAG